jgi:hypothetical protein
MTTKYGVHILHITYPVLHREFFLDRTTSSGEILKSSTMRKQNYHTVKSKVLPYPSLDRVPVLARSYCAAYFHIAAPEARLDSFMARITFLLGAENGGSRKALNYH